MWEDKTESQSMLWLAKNVKQSLRRIFFRGVKKKCAWFCIAWQVWQLFPVRFCPVAWVTDRETRQTDKRWVHKPRLPLQLGSHSKVVQKLFVAELILTLSLLLEGEELNLRTFNCFTRRGHVPDWRLRFKIYQIWPKIEQNACLSARIQYIC